jgi:hypothetical protein
VEEEVRPEAVDGMPETPTLPCPPSSSRTAGSATLCLNSRTFEALVAAGKSAFGEFRLAYDGQTAVP